MSLLELSYLSIPSALFFPLITPSGTIPDGCSDRVNITASISNERSYDTGTWGQIGVDMEQIRSDINYQRQSRNSAFEVGIPMQLNYPGVLDPFLDKFHKIFNRLDQVNLPGSPRSFAYLTNAQGGTFQTEGANFDINDIYAALSLSPTKNLWFKTIFTVPTGNPLTLHGAGVPLLGLSAVWSTGKHGFMAQATLPLSDPAYPFEFTSQPSYRFNAWAALGPHFRLTLIYQTSPIKNAGSFSSAVFSAIISYDSLLSFEEGFTGNSPDISFSINKEVKLNIHDCP